MTDSTAVADPQVAPTDSTAVADPQVAPEANPPKKLVTAVYALFAISFLFPVTAFFGVILAHIKRKDVDDTVLASHFRYQIRTFWFGFLGYLIAFPLTLAMGLGYFLALAVWFWAIYRVIKGWLRHNDGKPAYETK